MRSILCPACAVLSLSSFLSAAEVHWENCGWGGGGWFWSAVWDPADPDVAYMGGDVLGIYKSTDGGKSWTFVNRGLQNYAVYALAVAKSDPRVLYCMTVDGMARSDDAGARWTPLAATRKSGIDLSAKRSATIRGIAVSPDDSRTVYAGGGSGRLYKSSDAGETWTELDYLSAKPAGKPEGPAPAERSPVSAVAVSDSDSSLVFAAVSKNGLFRSADAGATWTCVVSAPAGAAHIAGGFSPAPGTFYAAAGKNGVWMSDDAGLTWKRLLPLDGKNAGAEGSDPAPPWSEKHSVRELAVNPRDPKVVHAIVDIGNRNSACLVTRDGGATWSQTRRYVHDRDANPTLPEEPSGRPKNGALYGASGLAVSPADPNRLLVAADWNCVRSEDAGATWIETAKGLDITCFHDLRFLGGSVFAVAMDEGLFRSDDNGATWHNLAPRRWKPGLSGHQWRVLPQPLPDGRVRILTTLSAWRHDREYPNQVLVTEDDGKTLAFATGLPDYIPHANTMWGDGYARAMAADPKNPDIVYLGIDGDPDGKNEGGGVFRSENGGQTFERVSAQPASRRMFYGLAVDPLDSSRLYWGACGENSGVYVSPDSGNSWRKTSVSDWVFNVETAPSGMVLAGGKQLWISRDHGNTWKKATDLENITVVGIAVDPEDERRIWISAVVWGTSAGGGVYESTDGGESWTEITGDIPYTRPLILRYNSATRELWAAGVGAFRTSR